MLRYLVMTFAWLFFSCTAMAEESNIGKALIVENNEGAKSVFLLKDYVNISFAHKQMSVRTNINDTIIDVKEISRMYFDYVEIDTGVEKCYQDTIKVIFKPTKIIIENIDKNYTPQSRYILSKAVDYRRGSILKGSTQKSTYNTFPQVYILYKSENGHINLENHEKNNYNFYSFYSFSNRDSPRRCYDYRKT